MFDKDWSMARRLRRGIEYALARIPVVERAYWRYAPVYYHWKVERQIEQDAPLHLFKVVWINPNKISRFTGRKKSTEDRWRDIGTVRGGNWDQSAPQGSMDPDKKQLYGIFTARNIEETDLFTSFQRHFNSDVSWEETSLFQSIHSAVTNGVTVWRGCQSREDILDRCYEIDELYYEIKNNGYDSQFELINRHGLDSKHVGYLDVLTDEVSIDIARDGELLFVDGRHRLCLAKILGLEAIPVVILVRHKQWLERRNEIYREKINPELTNHPDLAEAAAGNNHRIVNI